MVRVFFSSEDLRLLEGGFLRRAEGRAERLVGTPSAEVCFFGGKVIGGFNAFDEGECVLLELRKGLRGNFR